ncbi:MAG: PH domain-containing protein [Lentilactobacillus diolivorans]|jgi:hypothetical protein|nr:PH domain-containing protein [Lentilactobacillus diolivorans]
MKFGVRKPSLKKSISARTTGKLKRTVKQTVNPVYGKKGMGVVNDPKKALYNKVYNKTTVGVSDIINPTETKSPSTKTITTKYISNANKKDIRYLETLTSTPTLASTFCNFDNKSWSIFVFNDKLIIATARWGTKDYFKIGFQSINHVSVESHVLLSKLLITTDQQEYVFTSLSKEAAESIRNCVNEHRLNEFDEYLKDRQNYEPINQTPLHKWQKAFDAGYPLYMKSKEEFAKKNYLESINLANEALSVGYTNANVYERLAMNYRKLKQYDNEISILNDGLVQLKGEPAYNTIESNFKYRIVRATSLKENK